MTVAVIALVLGVAGLVISLVGVATQVMPRQFTAGQQRQITDWEFGSNWRTLTAGTIFPASVVYSPPGSLDDSGLTLTASRIGIARQASCTAATDAAVAAVLDRNGCAAMLRATYVDGTDSYVVTVGVAVMPGSAQAAAAERELPSAATAVTASGRCGSRALRAAAFTNHRRQISGVLAGSTGTYVFFYTIGYADGRPQVPVTADSYARRGDDQHGAGRGAEGRLGAGRAGAAAALPGDAGMLGGRGCRMVLAAVAAGALAIVPCAAAIPAVAAPAARSGRPRTPSGTARRGCSTCSTSSRRGRSPRAPA